MNFKELMQERQAILQGIEKQESILLHRLEEEHYQRIFQIIKEQAIAIQRDA